jgi:glyoxylase-like metal-dependent hydrolase (beta-lactamase superfamily II)
MKRVMLAALSLVLLGSASAKTLDIFFIDVEGGESTLIVTAAGESLLIDAGYAGRGGRDPARIVAAAREARVDHIDYLLITHFHPDHAGGVPELAALIPIGTQPAPSPAPQTRRPPASQRRRCRHRQRGRHGAVETAAGRRTEKHRVRNTGGSTRRWN